MISLAGSEARLTKLACIKKVKQDGSVKLRLVVDTRRSGVNGLTHIRERVVLPRISDVARIWQKLLELNNGQCDVEFFSADFSNAFNTLRLKDGERQFAVFKGLPDEMGRNRYYVSKVVVFGLAAGPLLWGRLCGAAMRLAQAMAHPRESEVATFVDDPVVVVAGQTVAQRSWSMIRYAALWMALGMEVAWHKADRGQQITWIGFQLEFSEMDFDLKVELTAEKRSKLLAVIDDISERKGMVPLQTLEHAVGILGWVTVQFLELAHGWLCYGQPSFRREIQQNSRPV